MEYTIKLTARDLDILSVALGEMPYKAVAPLIAKINQQVAEQAQSAEEQKE